MAELTISKDESSSRAIVKEVDSGAMELIFNALQQDMYSFPIASFIRETISNGLDSIVEKKIAIDILSGTPEDKYYLQRSDNKLLKDSSFDPTYYNTKWLSSDNKVYVSYTEDEPRDSITIKDCGVGLANARLQGYFSLG